VDGNNDLSVVGPVGPDHHSRRWLFFRFTVLRLPSQCTKW